MLGVVLRCVACLVFGLCVRLVREARLCYVVPVSVNENTPPNNTTTNNNNNP